MVTSLDMNLEYLEGVAKGLIYVLDYNCSVSLGFLPNCSHIWSGLYINYATKSSCLATSINPFPSSYLPLFYMTFCLMRFHIFPFVSYYFPVQNRSRKLHILSHHRILAVAHKYLYRLMPNSCVERTMLWKCYAGSHNIWEKSNDDDDVCAASTSHNWFWIVAEEWKVKRNAKRLCICMLFLFIIHACTFSLVCQTALALLLP